jgi:glyceraldehyde 3-phosphate dehydrogenase
MAVRVAINGFGRIGRNVLRAIIESGRKDIEVVSINDLGPVETNAHLLRFDSVHGRFPHEVKVEGDTIDAGRGKIKVTAERDPAKLPHKALGVSSPWVHRLLLPRRRRRPISMPAPSAC